MGLISRHPGRNQGGTAVRIVRLANHFAGRGLAVDLITLEAPEKNPVLTQLVPAVNVRTLHGHRKWAIYRALVGYLWKYRPKALLALDTRASLIASWARLTPGVGTRAFANLCNALLPDRETRDIRKERALVRTHRKIGLRMDGIIAVSRGLADEFVGETGVPQSKTQVIYNPVVSEETYRLAREVVEHPWLADGQPPVVLGVGRLSEQKDFPTLIRAFDRVRSRRNCRLLILGQGPEYPALSRLVRQLGREDEVDLAGFIPNPYAYMAKAGVYVLASRWEGLSNSLIEALAMGVPVVSTDCPSGPREILAGGRYGRLVPVGDPDAMADAIEASVDSPEAVPPTEEMAEKFGIPQAGDRYLQALGLNGAEERSE